MVTFPPSETFKFLADCHVVRKNMHISFFFFRSTNTRCALGIALVAVTYCFEIFFHVSGGVHICGVGFSIKLFFIPDLNLRIHGCCTESSMGIDHLSFIHNLQVMAKLQSMWL